MALIYWWTSRFTRGGPWSTRPVRLLYKAEGFTYISPLTGKHRGQKLGVVQSEVTSYVPSSVRFYPGSKAYLAEAEAGHYADKTGAHFVTQGYQRKPSREAMNDPSGKPRRYWLVEQAQRGLWYVVHQAFYRKDAERFQATLGGRTRIVRGCAVGRVRHLRILKDPSS